MTRTAALSVSPFFILSEVASDFLDGVGCPPPTYPLHDPALCAAFLHALGDTDITEEIYALFPAISQSFAFGTRIETLFETFCQEAGRRPVRITEHRRSSSPPPLPALTLDFKDGFLILTSWVRSFGMIAPNLVIDVDPNFDTATFNARAALVKTSLQQWTEVPPSTIRDRLRAVCFV